MKRIVIAVLVLCLALTSCSMFRSNEVAAPTADGSTVGTVTEPETLPANVTDTESAETAQAPGDPAPIGFYDDINDDGTFTRLDTYTAPWIAGSDIAVFDVIPSTAPSIRADSYKQMWQEEAAKVSPDGLVRAHFTLRYTRSDGKEIVCPINTPYDAEAMNVGFVEIYLYDDVHQADGAWYSHVTEADMTDETVFSSIKITAGAKIDYVTKIELDVYSGMSDNEAPATVVLVRE